jgi:hypothetical protein
VHLSLFAVEFSWGKIAKTDIDKQKVDNIIKEYVDQKYPTIVNEYHVSLQKQKSDMIENVNNITFINNNLMWQDTKVNVELQLNRLELKVYCRKLDFANRKDWRVPSVEDMISLIDYNKTTPASIDKIEHIIPLQYWTSSSSVLEKSKNWFIDFEYGTSGIDSDLVRYNIRCVRTVSENEGEY